MKTTLYIGVDGGGTHSTAMAIHPDGRILSRSEGGGLNYLNDGLEACTARFRRIVTPLLSPDAGAGTVVCAGLAALDGPATPEVQAAFQAALPSCARLFLTSDVTVALAGHTRGEPGAMAICGTGSMAVVRDSAGRERAAGGWGWKIGDPGSGCALAREGLYTALTAWEAEGKEQPLMKAALAFFSVEDPRGLIPAVYAPGVGVDGLAAFGAEVVRLAEAGDPEARGILSRQMGAFAALTAGLLRAAPEARERVGLFGGVFQHSELARKLFSDELAGRCPGALARLAETPPAQGAAILARMREEQDERD